MSENVTNYRKESCVLFHSFVVFVKGTRSQSCGVFFGDVKPLCSFEVEASNAHGSIGDFVPFVLVPVLKRIILQKGPTVLSNHTTNLSLSVNHADEGLPLMGGSAAMPIAAASGRGKIGVTCGSSPRLIFSSGDSARPVTQLHH